MRAHSVARLSPGALRCSAATGGLRNSDLRSSDSPRPFSRCALRCSTTQRARGKPNGQHALCASNSARCLPPLDDAEQRSAAGGSRRGLSEGQSPEFRSRPAVRVAQGTPPQAGRRPGVAFSLASFFWRPKERMPARQARNPAPQPPCAGNRPCARGPERELRP
jgi:hypothetical protein